MSHLKEVPLKKMVAQKSSFMDIFGHGKFEDSRNLGGILIKGMDESISSTKNKKFLGKYRIANDYYKNEEIGRIRSDVGKALLKGTLPKQAYDYMDSPARINEMSRILGPSPAAQQIVQGLKRAKLEEVIKDKVFTADGNLSYANLANLFSKNEGNQELFQSLLGKKSYDKLEELADVSRAHVKSGKDWRTLSE